jgi:hypothetical protein
MSSVVVVRNALILVGADAVSIYLALPFWLPVMLAWAKPMADGTIGVVGMHLVLGLAVGVVSGIAGVIAGWAMDVGSSRWWGVALGILVAIQGINRYGWRVTDPGIMLEVVVGGVLAFGGFLIGQDVRRRQESRKQLRSVVA